MKEKTKQKLRDKQTKQLDWLLARYYKTGDGSYVAKMIDVCKDTINYLYNKKIGLTHDMEPDDLYSLVYVEMKKNIDRGTFKRDKGKVQTIIYLITNNVILNKNKVENQLKNRMNYGAVRLDAPMEDGSTMHSFELLSQQKNPDTDLLSFSAAKKHLDEIYENTSTFELFVLYCRILGCSYEEVIQKLKCKMEQDEHFARTFSDIKLHTKAVDNAQQRLKQKCGHLFV